MSTVFVQAIQSAHRFDPDRGSAVPWLLGIAAHAHAGGRRRVRREQGAVARLKGSELLDREDYERLDAQIDAARLAPHVRQALTALPAAERQMVELTSFEGMTPGEAATALGIRPSAARCA